MTDEEDTGERYSALSIRSLPFSAEDDGPRLGEKVVFWCWAGFIAVGLAVMITLPLIGR